MHIVKLFILPPTPVLICVHDIVGNVAVACSLAFARQYLIFRGGIVPASYQDPSDLATYTYKINSFGLNYQCCKLFLWLRSLL